MIVITFTIGLLLVITRVMLITFTTQKTVTYATVSVMLQSGKPLVWDILQSGLCYSLGYVTVWDTVSLAYVTVWVMLQSGLCYSLGYVTVWVVSSLG